MSQKKSSFSALALLLLIPTILALILIVASKKLGGGIKNGPNPDPVFVKQKNGPWEYKGEIKQGGFGVLLGKDKDRVSVQLAKGDYRLTVTAASESPLLQEETGSVVYRSSTEKTEYQYRLTKTGVKEDIVLQSASEAKTSYLYEIDLENLNYRKGIDGLWYFYDKANGNYTYPLFVIPKPFMADAKGQKSDKVTIDSLSKDGKEYLEVKADMSWLNDSSRAYPVKIDPSFNALDYPEKDKYVNTSWLKDWLMARPDYANLPIVGKDTHAVHFQKPDGNVQAIFSQEIIYMKDDFDEWQPFDRTLVPVGKEYTVAGTDLRVTKEGKVYPPDKSFSHTTTRIGIFDPEKKLFIPIANLGEGEVKENRYLSSAGDFRYEVEFGDKSIKEKLLLDKLPSVDLSANQWFAMETEVDSVSLPDGWTPEFVAHGYSFPAPFSWDANQSSINTQRYALNVNGKQYVYTGVPLEELARVSYPVTIDPDFFARAGDGHVRGWDNSNYTNARATADDIQFTSTTWNLGQRNLGVGTGGISVQRGFFSFDTSSLPDSVNILQVNLWMTVNWDGSYTKEFDGVIKKYNWGSYDPITTSNMGTVFGNSGTGCVAATADDNIWMNSASVTAGVRHQSGNLNTSWVSTTGNTYYCIASSRDISATSPTGGEFLQMWDNDYGLAQAIGLIVVYSPAPTSCRLEENADDSQITVKWNDNSSTETGYEVEKSTDGGAYSNITTTAASATSYADSSVSSGHTYQYRIRSAYSGSLYSEYCYTPLLSLQIGNFRFEKLKIEGIKID